MTYLEFSRRGNTAWWRYPTCLLSAAVAAPALFIAVLLPFSLARLLPHDLARQMQQPAYPAMFFAGIVMTYGAFLACLIVSIGVLQRKRARDVVGHWSWALFSKGACVWVVGQLVITIADYVIAPHGFTFSATGATASLAICALPALAVQTFTEEFVFRGYITQAVMLATKQPFAAALVSGIIFGALHLWNGVPQACAAVAFGIVCSLIAIRTNGIAFTFGLHLVNNYFGAVIVVSAGDVFRNSPGLLLQSTPLLIWWDVALTILALAVMAKLLVTVLRIRFGATIVAVTPPTSGVGNSLTPAVPDPC